MKSIILITMVSLVSTTALPAFANNDATQCPKVNAKVGILHAGRKLAMNTKDQRVQEKTPQGSLAYPGDEFFPTW